ncbi:MAG: DUF4911 domain-containing protein [Desulfovibrionaceae bacterium]
MNSSKTRKSTYILIRISPKDIALLKYFLEAQDNLGYLKVIDKKSAFLYAITSYDQKEELLRFLNAHLTLFTDFKIMPEISL